MLLLITVDYVHLIGASIRCVQSVKPEWELIQVTVGSVVGITNWRIKMTKKDELLELVNKTLKLLQTELNENESLKDEEGTEVVGELSLRRSDGWYDSGCVIDWEDSGC